MTLSKRIMRNGFYKESDLKKCIAKIISRLTTSEKLQNSPEVDYIKLEDVLDIITEELGERLI